MTYDQHIASDPEFSVWVAANAGTGKTKVLTDRVLRLLLAGSRPDKILCITYTKAAAAEMEHRIETQLGEWAITEENTLRQKLSELTGKEPDDVLLKKARQLFAIVIDAPERIRIQTIHSFCQSVLKRFPLEAGVAPHFTVIDERTSLELLLESQRQLFNNPALGTYISALASMISEVAFDDLLTTIVRDRKKFSRWFEKESGTATLTDTVHRCCSVADGITPDQLYQTYFAYSDSDLKRLQAACTTLAEGSSQSDRKMFETLQSWLEFPHSTEAAKTYAHRFLTAEGEPLKNLCTAAIEKRMPGLKDILRTEQERAVKFMQALRSLQIVEATSLLVQLAEALLGVYKTLKDAHGYMDYDDIIAHTVKLLTRQGAAAWVLYKLDGGLDHLLVDEAQDTSPEQWKLVEVLADEFFSGSGARLPNRSLFVVGDGKQSIYSFQGAEPLEFESMQSKLRRRIEASDKKFRNVQLALSFRSTEAVLQAVDETFAQPAARDGLIFSESSIMHAANRKGMAGRVEIWPLAGVEEEKENTTRHPEALLANAIADEIHSWLDKKRKILSQDRPVQPGDILILVQRRSDFIPALTRALKKQNINVAGADRLVLTSHIAVEDCIALANFLLLPTDDMTLATVLKSPFGGLSEKDIFELAYDRKKMSLWQRLKENVTFSDAYEYLARLLAKVDYLPPYELFAYILENAKGRKKLAERLGTEIYDPLNEFLSLAIEYSDTHTPSLQGFLHWLASGETEIKRDMEKAKNEVRIMTVHGAKGLQAPIVFLPDTTRMPLQNSGLLWTPGEDKIPLWAPSAEHTDIHYQNLKETLKQEREREYRRLLYVAMTRAEDELYICGWKGKKAVSERCWYELVRAGLSNKWQNEHDRTVLTCPQTVPAKAGPERVKTAVNVSLPAWVEKPPMREAALSKPLSPSRMDTIASAASPLQDQTARLRGTLIHKLLQYMPEVEDKREEAMQRFIERYGAGFNTQMQNTIRREVMHIIQHPDFAPVFATDSVAEAPISGITHNSDDQKVVISGQIDRLAVAGDTVYIIDYKTGIHVPESEGDVPKPYIAQMEAYRNLVAQIYPDKKIQCALLWTSAPKLMLLTFLQVGGALSQAS